MDKLKKVLRVLKKHRFWVLSGTITLFGVIVWFLAIGALDAEFLAEKNKIDGQYSKVNQVLGVVNHPNDFSQKRMDEINASTKERVYQAWMTQWERQMSVLVWPPELEKDFEAVVTALPPAEAFTFPTPPDQEIGIQYRARYRDYIQTVLPQLAKIIDSNWDARTGGDGMAGATGIPGQGSSGLSGFGGGPLGPGGLGAGGTGFGVTGTPEPNHVVQWAPQNQTNIATRYDWSSRADNMPKTLEILYAQEDLWILTSLMNVIARTNDGADARYKATVKEITSIDLGAAAQLGGTVQRLDPGPAGQGGGEGAPLGSGGQPGMLPPGGAGVLPPTALAGGPGPPGMAGSAGSGGPAPGQLGAGGAAAVDPLDYRYVDTNLQPLRGTRIRDSLNVKDPKDALLAVVKRMPVRIQLVVDIRRLNRLLAECGNSHLPLEIRQVRINRQGAVAGAASGGGMLGSGGMVGGGMLGGGGPRGGEGGGPKGPVGGMLAGPTIGGGGQVGGSLGAGMGTGVVEEDPYVTQVELFGLVYLFNRVNEAKLGTPKAGPAAPGATAGGVAPPVGTTGAAGLPSPPSG